MVVLNLTSVAALSLLLCGCNKDKKSPEEAFQAYLEGNKLYTLLKEEKKQELAVGIQANSRDLKDMIDESANVLLMGCAERDVENVFDIAAFKRFVDENPKLRAMVNVPPDQLQGALSFALLNILLGFISDLADAPEMQITEAELEKRAFKALQLAFGAHSMTPFSASYAELLRRVSANEALRTLNTEYLARVEAAQQSSTPGSPPQGPPLGSSGSRGSDQLGR